MKFIDEARIRVFGGDGGNGACAFLREKYRPMGGPSGGDGGRGGCVWAVASSHMTTLQDYRFKREIKADRGGDGQGKGKHGRAAGDIELPLPIGSIIRDLDSGQVVGDLIADGQRVMLAGGGDGGRGNARFATPTNQAPRRADHGGPGEQHSLEFELRLLADAGIIGLPNAGKSSLLSRLSAARPRIADYPFTTLVPTLGVVAVAEEASFVMADIPGLIEGAHQGHGLGTQFLRHVDRAALLVHMVDASGRDAEQVMVDFDTVNGELRGFAEQLANRPQVVVVNRTDLPDATELLPALRRLFAERNIVFEAISAATGEGCARLAAVIWKQLRQQRGDNAKRQAMHD